MPLSHEAQQKLVHIPAHELVSLADQADHHGLSFALRGLSTLPRAATAPGTTPTWLTTFVQVVEQYGPTALQILEQLLAKTPPVGQTPTAAPAS